MWSTRTNTKRSESAIIGSPADLCHIARRAVAVFGLAGGIVLSQGEHQAAGILGIIAVALGSFLAVLALPGIIGGWALFSGRSWGRPLVLVLGFLDLINIPFGTALGVYTIWALLHEPVSQLPSASTNQPIA